MKTYLVILAVFGKTICYVIWSFLQPKRLQELKQMWAQSLLDSFEYKIHVSGEPPVMSGRPMILVGNHISFLDILVLMASTRDIVFIAKKEVRSWPIIGFAAARVYTVFVDRENKKDRSQIRDQIAQQLKEYKAKVVVFPSGTTTLKEELLWKKGMFEVAAEAHLPVKAFVLAYTPFRESAYIDDDSLIGQMNKIVPMPVKTAHLTWLDEYKVVDPASSAETIRQKVVQKLEMYSP